MSELKTVVILDGEIINIGEWNYQYTEPIVEIIDGEENIIEPSVALNPLPEGAIIEQREMIYSAEKGWHLANVAKPPTIQERLDQMESMLITLLEVL